MLGLEKGIVVLCEHETAWEENAKTTIQRLKKLFGILAIDIQHIGSTAIPAIMAKPIIDIVVGINDFDKLHEITLYLETNGLIHRPNNDLPEYRMFIFGNIKSGVRTHHIHVVPYAGAEWQNQINFRDYLNANLIIAKEYESLKIQLYNNYSDNRVLYTNGKDSFIQQIFLQAEEWRRNQ